MDRACADHSVELPRRAALRAALPERRLGAAAHTLDRRLRTRRLPDPVRRQLPSIVVETSGSGQPAAQRGMHRSLRRTRRQRGRRSGDRRSDHRGVSHHRGRRKDGARAPPDRKCRTDGVCHRTIGRSVARTSTPGIAGDHRRTEYQRPALHRPRPIRKSPRQGSRGAGRGDAHVGSSQRVELGRALSR